MTSANHQPPVALVTGAAKRIGAAIVERLAADGYAVAIHCNASRVDAEALATRIRARGGTAQVFAADLVDPVAVAALVPAVTKAMGPVTLLVNNASLFADDQLATFDVLTWNRQFSVNLRAPSALAQAMAALLPIDRPGSIINIIDQRVLKLTPEYYSYTLTKSALWTATRTMAQSLAPRIRVNAVSPGPTLGNIHDGDAGVIKEAAGTLLGRQIDPAAVADAVAFLAKAEFITGQMLCVDSGQHLGWRTPDIVGP